MFAVTADNPALMRHFEAEQDELVTLCEGLTQEQWAVESLCPNWTVRQTVVHVAWHIHRSTGETLHFLLYGPAKGSYRQIARDETRSTANLITWLASPGNCGTVNLGELVIHQQDIRRPLGLMRQIPADRLTPVLGFSLTRASTGLVPGSRKRAMGIRLVATDMDWSAGDGPEVRGNGEALIMAINGRASALDDLEGPGLATLASRQPTKRR